MTDTATIMDLEQTLDDNQLEELHKAVGTALLWDVEHRPGTKGAFAARVATLRQGLSLLEERLAAMPIVPPHEQGNQGEQVGTHQADCRSALLELRENSRLVRTAIITISGIPRSIVQLPRVIVPGQKDEPRVAALAAVYLHAVEFNFSAKTFCIFLQELQGREHLLVDELWSMSNFLQFALLESLLNDANALLSSPDSIPSSRLSSQLRTLRMIGMADWASLIEPLILFDATLREDPGQSYVSMDFESRDFYRKRVAFVARHSDYSEIQVAQTALSLAQEAVEKTVDDPRLRLRMIHIGYYLIDSGFDQLAARVAFHPPLFHRVRAFIRNYADDFYITGTQLITVLLIAIAIIPVVPHASLLACLALTLVLVLPAMQNAVELVNSTVSAIFDPQPLPKIDFSNGISAECATLVTVPTLLLSEDQVRGLVMDLEARFLANRDPHLHFALLTDLPDSITKPHDRDFHFLVELAVQLIGELNAKYGSSPTSGSFLLLHRHRIFNVRQGAWMGWERKRGKLLDLNKLLANEYDAFPIKAGPLEALHQIRYILTLDSDTQLPQGSAARLIGAMAHPLNQAVIDPKLRIVTAGYGILQPRIGVNVQSASRSRLAAIYSGQSGFDIYTRAVSDAYQDLYGEGSFTGKGIYEVAILHAVLDRRFPRNALLSHDLIEGAYARAGLATDIELIDDYPSHLSAYNRRKHRWVRGDWQIVQWIFPRVPEESGRKVPNPISDISRWKIFDNLRRSLVDPFTFMLFVVAWLVASGGPLYWTLVLLGLLFFPAFVQLAFSAGGAIVHDSKGGVSEAFFGFSRSLLVTVLNLVFLPQQALLSFDAIVRSLVRRFITGNRLLEWETAAQAEAGSTRRTPVDRYLVLSPVIAFGVALLVYFANRHSNNIVVATPVLLLWAVAPVITRWLNASPREQKRRLASSDEVFLLGHALRIWRFFHQFGSERHNYLIPDNVEEDGLFEAARFSPTNVGFLLNAEQAACELGFVTAPEFAALTERSLATIARLDKHRGHLYNWYDTQSLNPLGARMISSVDSGNFVASLYTLHAGVRDLLKQPLFSLRLFTGLGAFLEILSTAEKSLTSLPKLILPGPDADISEWVMSEGIAWLSVHRAQFVVVAAQEANQDASWWLTETGSRIDAILALVRDYMPWLLPEFAPLRELPQLAIGQEGHALAIERAAAFSDSLEARLAATHDVLESGTSLRTLGEKLASLLPDATRKLIALVGSLRAIAQNAETLAEETEFGFLVSPVRKMLSIGYDVETQKLHDSCYDLLASEARIATFLAIARGELSQRSWFKMGREHAAAYGQFLLFSWTGTMFEYLMPALWMRNFPDTLISRTLTACLRVQVAFCRSLKIPWGISESGFAQKDEGGHYQYHAFGLPCAALKLDASAGPVVSPYSTFLALNVDSLEALRNLHRMDSLGWVGAYGFYEAADYSTPDGGAVLVREWMAHHQGMSLLAILNLLHGDVVQRWFHANPLIQSAELLLHEMPVRSAVLKATLKEFPEPKH